MASEEPLSQLWLLDAGVCRSRLRRRLRCLRHLDGMASDALNSATRCGAPLARPQRVSIGQPLFVASPYGAHVGRFLPDCPAAERLAAGHFFAIQTAWLTAGAGSAQVTFLRPGCQSQPPAKPLRRGSSCNQPAPTRLTPMKDSLPARLESGFPGGIVAGRLPRIRSIPWPPVRTGKAFCAFRW